MHRFTYIALLSALCLPAWADEPSQAPVTAAAATVTAEAPAVNPDEIIRKFAAKEKEFSEARQN